MRSPQAIRPFTGSSQFPEVFFDPNGQLAPNGGFDAVIGNPPWALLPASAGYRHRTSGHLNSYQLFLDRALQLTRPGGRIGLILPSGIATDHGSAALRRHLFDRTSIDTWIGFDNRAAFSRFIAASGSS